MNQDVHHRWSIVLLGALGTQVSIALLIASTALADDPPTAPKSPKHDLLSVAKREADRESASLHGRIRTLLAELALRNDPNDPYVSSRVGEIARIGSLALPNLTKAMDPAAEERSTGVQNIALNAARAIAKMPGQAVTSQIVKLAREGGVHGRRNATIAIGLRGDPSLFPVVREICERAAELDKSIVAEAIRSIGLLGGDDAVPILLEFVESTDALLASRAIEGLATLVEKRAAERVLARFEAEYVAPQPSDPLLRACLEFAAAVPTSEALDAAGRALADTLRATETRGAAARAIGAIARKYDGAKRRAIGFLDAAIASSTGLLLEQVAYEMQELGDGSGVAAVVAPLDKQIKDEPKNFALRYQRGDVFLRLKDYVRARKDYLEGLKLERDPRQPDRVYIALARCSAALNEDRQAATYLEKLESLLGDQDFSGLPRQHPEFASMAKDSRFDRLFAAPIGN
jgi:tetratricopeptide (TPR) repeat protein